MNINYDVLKELQTVLADFFVIEDRIKEIPKDLKDKEEVLQKTKMDYLELHKKCESIRQDVDSLWQRYTQTGAEREEKEKQIELTTLSREFENLNKEIEQAKKTEGALLKSYNAKKKYLEDLEIKLQVSSEMVDEQEEEVNREKEKNVKLIEKQENLLKEKQAERDRLSKDIPADVLFKFERIIRNKGGMGVVPVHGIICQGCHMELPQQFANDVRRNDEIHFCPYCSRVLYYEESDEDERLNNQIHGDIHVDEEEVSEGGSSDFIGSDENLFDD